MPLADELFRTERLIVRRMHAGDVDELYAVYSDPEAMRWVDDGQPIPYEDCPRWIDITAKNYATRGYGMSVVLLAESGRVLGFCGIVHPGGQAEAEIKYAFRREHWGQGIATETVKGMLAYGRKEFAITRVIATLSPENLASKRVLEKAGMRELERRVHDDGEETLVLVLDAPESA